MNNKQGIDEANLTQIQKLHFNFFPIWIMFLIKGTV